MVLYSPPYSTQAAGTALQYVKTALSLGHDIYRIFFYNDGVHNASKLIVCAQDESNIARAWQELIEKHGIDTVACVSSALKRGIVDKQEAQRYELECDNLIDSVSISGLGQRVDAVIPSDRFITFVR